MEREKVTQTLPYGVSPIVREFLSQAIELKLHDQLDTESSKYKHSDMSIRNLIGIYYGSDATTYDIGKMFGVSRNRITQLIKEGMRTMWLNLPDYLRDEFSEQDILKMKIGHSPRTINKFIQARKGKPSPLRGVEHTTQQNDLNRQRSLDLWQDPMFREKTLEGQEEYRKRRFFTAIPEESKRGQKKKKDSSTAVIRKKDLSHKGIISVSETVLQSLICDLINRRKRKNLPTTLDDVSGHLEFLGITHNTQVIVKLLAKNYLGEAEPVKK